MLALANCPKLPQASRQAMLDGYKAMADMWKSIDFKTLPPAALQSMDDGCKQGVDAVKSAIKSTGC